MTYGMEENSMGKRMHDVQSKKIRLENSYSNESFGSAGKAGQ